jgi:hypothetical protein
MTTENGKQWWWFTFGYSHIPPVGYYVKFFGTRDHAREQMEEIYGDEWSFQYPSAETAGVDRFHLEEWKGHNKEGE